MNNNADNKNTDKSNEEEPIKQWSLKKFKWNRDTFLILVLIGLIIFVVFVPLESRSEERRVGKVCRLGGRSSCAG